MRFEVEHNRTRRDKSMLQRYNAAWKCGVCQKIGSTKKIIVDHLYKTHKIHSDF